ncbi:hypothetical protein Goshw_025382 [Gossypium schwendimanii]|uniref:PGG domain-containing protein n=1 Tax=Gossypium schwendimanii TaxID=34291 RepID=A0A7J9MEN0_GOSSC|nr:hypothetical protein [Gossypium schwendimanii]
MSTSTAEIFLVEVHAACKHVEARIIKVASSSSQATTVVNLSSNGNPAGNNAYLRPTLHLTLYKAALTGDWESATRVFEQNPKAATAMIMGSMYALHVAVGARKANEFVEKLVERMSLEEVAMVNGSGATTLSIAAAIGNTDVVKLLVCKNPDLPNIRGMDGGFPIHRAAQFGHRETLLYLLQVTKAEVQPSPYEKLLVIVIVKNFNIELNMLWCGEAETDYRTHEIPEIVEKIRESFQVAVQFYDNEGCNPFQRAVLFRHHKVFSLISRIIHEQKLIVADNMDNFSNNMLHLVENLSPPDQLNRVYGAALQMQRELQWEVENVVPNIYQDARNIERKAPRIVFTEEYKELVKEGERWMKDATNSCSVVAALIATVVFAAAITVLGGTNGDIEFLVFKSEKAFVIFAMSDAPSLFSSTSAILMFLSMLTARYVEDDFLQALPKRLIMGLLTLFISITTMMIAFSSTLYLVFGEAKGEFGWAVRLPVLSVKTAVAVRLDTVA